MNRRRRFFLLLFLAVAFAALLLLSVSLSRLQLQPGRPFYLGEPEQRPSPGPEDVPALDLGVALRLLMPLVVWIGLPLFVASLIWAIVRKKKEYLIAVLLLVGWSALIVYMELNVMQNPAPLWQAPSAETPAEAAETPLPTDVFRPQTPEWLVYATSIGLAVLLVGMVLALWQAWRRQPRPLDLVAQEAQAALEQIDSGADWRDVIIRCYAEMCRALRRSKGVVRRAAVTPREFALQLEEAGLPGEEVHRLTHLFEAVRYSSRPAQADEEREAVDCLATIVRTCRGEA